MMMLDRMEELHMSQKQLAELMGCSQQYVSKVLKGQENLSLETLSKIERCLNLQIIAKPELAWCYNIGWHISTNPRFDKMLGFSMEDVRAMLTYYKEVGRLPANSDVEAMIADMKPWYDNYSFR